MQIDRLPHYYFVKMSQPHGHIDEYKAIHNRKYQNSLREENCWEFPLIAIRLPLTLLKRIQQHYNQSMPSFK